MPIHYTQASFRKQHVGSGIWELTGLNEITVLFGKNGSGKSVFLRAWRDSSRNTIHYVSPERSGDMQYQANYIADEMSAEGRSNASGRNYVTDYRKRVISRIQTYMLARGNHRGTGALPADPSEIEGFIGSLIPDFEIAIVNSIPPYKLKRLANDEEVTQIDQLSSGEAQMLTIALDLLSIAAMWEVEDKEQRLILIDEPDAHIHPDLQARFADFLMRVAERYRLQFVIATHSTSLLSAIGQFGKEKASVAYIGRQTTNFKAVTFSEIQRELASCLGGHVLMGPLFGAKILLVEGDDDFRIWSQVPRYHHVNLAVIPSNGEEIYKYQKSLEALLASLCDRQSNRLGFALLDGDKALPQRSSQNPQDYIEFRRLNCHEAENLFLTDQVLFLLGKTWAESIPIIVQNAHRFGQKEQILRGAANWNRQTHDIKIVINEIAAILDPKPLHWTIRVGQAIGKSRPEGQLTEFLGIDFVNLLWPVQEGV